jgi:hypothetical protein
MTNKEQLTLLMVDKILSRYSDLEGKCIQSNTGIRHQEMLETNLDF